VTSHSVSAMYHTRRCHIPNVTLHIYKVNNTGTSYRGVVWNYWALLWSRGENYIDDPRHPNTGLELAIPLT